MPEIAQELYRQLKPHMNVFYDEKGAVGRRYRRQDEIGTPYCITVDGQTREKPVPRFDKYCTYHRIATLSVAQGLDPEQVHTVTIEIHPEQPDRSAVAFRLKDPDTELKLPKYQGTSIRVSKILVLGDVVE